jgi:hypothetical protein
MRSCSKMTKPEAENSNLLRAPRNRGRVGRALQQDQVTGIVDDGDRRLPFVARGLGFARLHHLDGQVMASGAWPLAYFIISSVGMIPQ